MSPQIFLKWLTLAQTKLLDPQEHGHDDQAPDREHLENQHLRQRRYTISKKSFFWTDILGTNPTTQKKTALRMKISARVFCLMDFR